MYRNRTQQFKLPETVDLQELGSEIRIYGELDHPYMRDFNPAIIWDGDRLKIAIRRCNFKVERGGAWSFRDGSAYSKTTVMYGDLDPDTLQVSNLTKLQLSKNSPTRTKVAGLEDVRIVKRKDGIHAIGYESDRLTASLHNASSAMADYLIRGNELQYVKTLEKPVREIVEKNWCPPDVESKLFDYTYSPTQVYKDGKLIGEPYTGIIHGGTVLLKQKDGYLSIVHDKRPVQAMGGVYDRFVYINYLAKHDKQGMITNLSKGFRCGTLENIEFISGFIEYKDSYILTVGIRDCKYGIIKIRKSKLDALFAD